MSWNAIAERAARERGDAILAEVRAAIARHAPDTDVRIESDALRVRGRRLRQRWLSEAGLRFARRIP